MRILKSEPSGFADNTRPAPLSRKKGRPGGVRTSANENERQQVTMAARIFLGLC
jgi:hypothetical protein